MKFSYLKPKLIMVVLIFVSLIFSGKAFSISTIPDNLLASPVLIKTKQSTASGFYYKQNGKYYLVTARHVLFNFTYVTFGDFPKKFHVPKHLQRKIVPDYKSKRLYFSGTMSKSEKDEIVSIVPNNTSFENKIKELYNLSQVLKLKIKKAKLISYSSKSSKVKVLEKDVDFEALNKEHLVLYNKSRDIAAVEIGKLIVKEDGKSEIYYNKAVKVISAGGISISTSQELLKKFDDVLVGNEVYVFGYPTSLSISPEIDINKPLLRRGIIAGKNENFKTIILDCPAFFGNSGGLVLEIEQVALGSMQGRAIGIISKFVPFLKGWKENSGYSIAEPMDGLIELLSD